MKYAVIDGQETCYLSVCDILSGDYASREEATQAMLESYTEECFYVKPLIEVLRCWPDFDVYHDCIGYYSAHPSTEGFMTFAYIKNYLIA